MIRAVKTRLRIDSDVMVAELDMRFGFLRPSRVLAAIAACPKSLPRDWMIMVILSTGCLAGCGKIAPTLSLSLKLGDSKQVMLQKMTELDARDVTDETSFSFYHAIAGEQEYYWWELKDETIVAVLLAGEGVGEMEVSVIEIGDSGKGVDGIANWREQKLTRYASF